MNKKKKLSLLLLILLLLGLLSASVLASRLGNLNKKKDDGVTIPIGDDAQKVSQSDEDEDVPLEAELVIKKDATIFCTYYEDGHVTVRSGDGDEVVAPGTMRNYNFALMNTKNASLDYELYITATVEGLEDTENFPVLGRMKGPDKWVIGKGGKYVPILKMPKRADTGVLAGGNIATYTFGWKWPFESGNDELDTMLGNMTIEEPIILKINIRIYAWNDEIPDKPGGEPPSPPTGDDFNIGFWMSLMIISLFAFVAVLAKDRKERGSVQEVIAQTAGGNEEKRE